MNEMKKPQCMNFQPVYDNSTRVVQCACCQERWSFDALEMMRDMLVIALWAKRAPPRA